MARVSTACVVGVFAIVMGCKTAHHIHDPEYARVSQATRQAMCAPVEISDEHVATYSLQLEGPHELDDYIQFALRQNPDIQAARKRVEALAYQVPVAASLQDPMLNVTVQPEPVQTAAGQQELMVSASQKLHWFGKLDARAGVAEAQTNVARAALAATELATIAKVKRAYFELYYIQQAISVTEAEQRLLVEIRDVASARYRSSSASQQDVLRAELEISNVESDLIRLRQQLESGQARLARVLHVPAQTRLRAPDQLPRDHFMADLNWLQIQAVAARPELHAQLAAIDRDQRAVELARLEYKPDVTLGVSWIDVASTGVSPVANGRDALLLTTGVNLPIYRKRLAASVRSAEAQAVSSAREYDALRDGTLENVTDLFAQATSQQETLQLFEEDILPKARQTFEVSVQAYNVGQVDFLTLIDNWRRLLHYELTHRRIEASLHQVLADLERVVGGFGGPSAEPLAIPIPEPQPLPPAD